MYICVFVCIFVYIFVYLCIFLYIRTYLQKMRRAICDKKIYQINISLQYTQPSLQCSQPSHQCPQPSEPWAPDLWSARDTFFQNFQEFSNVRKLEKLTFPDS